jgi:hypothetical protein
MQELLALLKVPVEKLPRIGTDSKKKKILLTIIL